MGSTTEFVYLHVGDGLKWDPQLNLFTCRIVDPAPLFMKFSHREKFTTSDALSKRKIIINNFSCFVYMLYMDCLKEEERTYVLHFLHLTSN